MADKEARPEAGGSSICLLLQVTAYNIVYMHIDTLYYVYVLCSPIRLDEQIIRIVLLYSMCFRIRNSTDLIFQVVNDKLKIANKIL